MANPKLIKAAYWTRFIICCLFVVLASGCSIGGAYFFDDGFRLAHDAKTGRYTGEVVGDCKNRDKDTFKDVKCYKVRREDGTIIEVPAEKITLSKP